MGMYFPFEDFLRLNASSQMCPSSAYNLASSVILMKTWERVVFSALARLVRNKDIFLGIVTLWVAVAVAVAIMVYS